MGDKKTPEFYVKWNGEKCKWRHSDNNRPPDASCYDCSLPYSAAGDCVIPNDIWELINPTYHVGAGILCPNCILERLHHLGIAGVKTILW